VPDHVVTVRHQAGVRAARRPARRAVPTRTGLHRVRGESTKPIERSHVPFKDRLRPTRVVPSVATGQRLREAIEAVRAIRRAELWAPAGTAPADPRGAARARAEVATLHRLARELLRTAYSRRGPRPAAATPAAARAALVNFTLA
jgi:hypothetical protein